MAMVSAGFWAVEWGRDTVEEVQSAGKQLQETDKETLNELEP